MPDFDANQPSDCVGPQSDLAGKAAPCQGCPNQGLCSTGAGKSAVQDNSLVEIGHRMKSVHHKIIILSGKGGVGKSTLTSTLARAFASDSDTQVAVLDIDICGPSQPRMMGAEGQEIFQSGDGWAPVFVDENLCLMSIGFMLENEDKAVIWRGPRKNGMIKQFLKDVDWGDIDYMFLDTPPGTSDEHLSLVQCLLNVTPVDGAIIITTPQQVSLSDVRKEINFCRKVKLPILGVVENMVGFTCPKCQHASNVFKSTNGTAEDMCREFNLPMLAQIPLDPNLTRCCDEGSNFLENFPDSPAAKAYQQLKKALVDTCGD